MYLPIPKQPDCVSAWREATRIVEAEGHEASNVIIDIADPTARASLEDPAVRLVDAFLLSKDKKAIETVANTIFPAGLYRRYGAPAFFDRFLKSVLPKVRRSGRWSGYYFERMIQLPVEGGPPLNQLENIIARIRDPHVTARNKFELSIFDPARDVDRSPYGGQCLSFGSFKLRGTPGGDRLDLTVLYRNHFYIEKLLGNLIGLGRLMAFIAEQSEVCVGSLTVISTHAKVDLPNGTKRAEIAALLEQCV
jgi:thymidylate synthase